MTASHPSIQRLRRMANLLDSAVTIPLIRKKVGLDPLLSLLPGAGDTLGLLLSSYALWVAFELGLPRIVMMRIVVNIVLDWLIGLIPVVGDVADIFWKANQMNLQIVEAAYREQLAQGDSAQSKTVTIDVTVEPV